MFVTPITAVLFTYTYVYSINTRVNFEKHVFKWIETYQTSHSRKVVSEQHRRLSILAPTQICFTHRFFFKIRCNDVSDTRNILERLRVEKVEFQVLNQCLRTLQ